MSAYDFGTSARGSLLSNQQTGYSSGFITGKALTDGTNVVQETTYAYDGAGLQTTSGVPQHVAVSGSRGNLTSVASYIDSSHTYSQGYTYADTGSVLSSVNPVKGTTTFGYDNTYVYNTGITPPTPPSGASLAASATFDTSHTGLPLTAADANGTTVVTVASYDSMLRATEVDTPLGGHITYTYAPTQIGRHRAMSAGTEDAESIADAYGRPVRTATATGNSSLPWYLQDTCYDAAGRMSFTSLPYAGTSLTQSSVCSGAGNSYTYDALGRPLTITHPGSPSMQTISYVGRTTKTVDENGVTKLTQVDGLGRITAVCEVTSVTMANSGAPATCGMDIAGTGYLTTYAYNLNAHTTTVTQGTQTRIFTTDWLGRTTSVQEPESGTTTYAYSQNSTGLVVTRVRPRANQTNGSVTTTTTTQYDNAGRVLSVGYNDGTPTKTYTYDEATAFGGGTTNLGASKGMLTGATLSNGVAKTAFGYDTLGRVTLTEQCQPSNCSNTSLYKYTGYSYDAIGNLLSASDGSGVTASYTYTVASEPITLNSTIGSNPATGLISSAQYGVYGPNVLSYGNGLSLVNQYDSRGLLNAHALCAGSTAANCSGGTALATMTTNWSGSRVGSSSDSVLGQTFNYGYDDMNRLASRTTTAGTTQNFTYSYDRWGNRVAQTAQQGGPSPTATYTAANQITGGAYSYDAAGNVLSDGAHNYLYDAENNMVSMDGSTYTYDALNHRVRISGAATAEYVFHPNGSRASAFDGSGNFVASQSYLGSQPVAFFNSTGYHFQHQDWLGTERLRTTSSGTAEGSYVSLPYGDGYSSTGIDQDTSHFTGLDTDSNSSNSHAMFRTYSAFSGRWMSPDPYTGSYDSMNPQSLNRYSYVLNNPLSLKDRLGLYCEYQDDTGSEVLEDVDYDSSFEECGATGGNWFEDGKTIFGGGPSTTGSDGTGYLGTSSPGAVPNIGLGSAGGGSQGSGSSLDKALKFELKAIKCNLSTALKDGIPLAADILGAIPGEGQTFAAVQIGASLVGMAWSLATAGPEDAGWAGAGSGGSIVGSLITLSDLAGKTVGAQIPKLIPLAGNAYSAVMAGHDMYVGVKDNLACLAGK